MMWRSRRQQQPFTTARRNHPYCAKVIVLCLCLLVVDCQQALEHDVPTAHRYNSERESTEQQPPTKATIDEKDSEEINEGEYYVGITSHDM